MSLVGKVGRKRFRARFAMAVLYLVLCLGALTTVYPFILMLSTGLKGPTDQNDNQVVPRYLQADSELVSKYVDDKYSGNRINIASTRNAKPADEKLLSAYERFLKQLPLDCWRAGFQLAPNQVTSRLRVRYQSWLRTRYRDIQTVNRKYIEEAIGFQTIDVPAELLDRKTWNPPNTTKYQEWLEFKAALPVEFRIPIQQQRIYQVWASKKWQNQIDLVPAEVRGQAKKFDDLMLPKSGAVLSQFIAEALPTRYIPKTVEDRWREFLAAEGFTGDQLTSPMPIEQAERAYVASHSGELRREFSARNFTYVLDYIVLNGRALVNTVIFCLLTIAVQLMVNPLAAYALSRYPVRQSGKILIFLLATMAFPAEVAMIPSFLLLKDLGLLNTFAALVLPSAASGYMIFLLKGFFDSLPQELFEAGQLDGAKETTMMFRIAFPLSRPVLGYLALMAFMGSYGAFLYAFLVVQDQRMWTLMVWIYQLQITAPKSVMMAALTLAALPTLIVFLCAQRVIMRGIVLPGER